MRAFLSRFFGLAVGVAVGIGFLWLALRHVDVEAVGAALARADWGLPAATVLAATAVFVLAKCWRWRLLLGAPPYATIAELVRPTVAGLALNALVPHAGEFVRALSLNRRHGAAGAGVLASIVVERVFDLFAVLLIAAAAVGLTPVSPSVAVAVRLLGAVAGVGAALIVVILCAPDGFRIVVRRFSGRFPERLRGWLLREVEAALAGFAAVRSPGRSVRVLLWSLVQWLAIAVCAAGSCAVVGVPVTAGSALLVVVGIVVAFLLPNAPGYAGSAQVAFVVSLEPTGVTPAAAVAASVVYQALMVLPVVVFGLAWLRGCLAVRDRPVA